MITSQINPENQILKSALPRATLSARRDFGHWDLVIGHSKQAT
jgi:hypothetical protein